MSTLVSEYLKTVSVPHYMFDMENPEDQARLSEPMLALKGLKRIVVIDEIQRIPDLFPVLRVLADRHPNPARFLILGSASPELLRQSSESLAGRIYYHELGGFSLEEVDICNADKLWEGFVIDQIIRHLGARTEECHFWATHAGAELDLLVVRGRKRYGFEIKRTTTPKVTPSMRHALADIKLESLQVIHAGEHSFPLSDRIQAVALQNLLIDVAPL